MAQCVSAMRAPLANLVTQCNIHWHGHCLHALVSCHTLLLLQNYTKIASSAARTVLPTTIQLITPTQCARLTPYRDMRCFTRGSPLERLHTRYSGSGDHLCIRVAAQSINSSWLGCVRTPRVVARCGARRRLMH